MFYEADVAIMRKDCALERMGKIGGVRNCIMPNYRGRYDHVFKITRLLSRREFSGHTLRLSH